MEREGQAPGWRPPRCWGPAAPPAASVYGGWWFMRWHPRPWASPCRGELGCGAAPNGPRHPALCPSTVLGLPVAASRAEALSDAAFMLLSPHVVTKSVELTKKLQLPVCELANRSVCPPPGVGLVRAWGCPWGPKFVCVSLDTTRCCRGSGPAREGSSPLGLELPGAAGGGKAPTCWSLACEQRRRPAALGSSGTPRVVCRGAGRTSPRWEDVHQRGWELPVACVWHGKRPCQSDRLVWAEAALGMACVR